MVVVVTVVVVRSSQWSWCGRHSGRGAVVAVVVVVAVVTVVMVVNRELKQRRF